MPAPRYLEPYLQAAQRHGGGFESLLWANPRTQAVRFAALARWCELDNRTLLDAGCGRADFLDYLLARDIHPARYIGLEAVEPLAAAAEAKRLPNAAILRGDFVGNPAILDQGADVIVFSGSLNTLSPVDFHDTLLAAWQYTRNELAFNFLCSPHLASGEHLTWYHISDVRKFVSVWTEDIVIDDAYRSGDCTMALRKSDG